MILRHTVSKSDGGVRVLTVLRRDMGLSSSMVRRLKRCRGIKVDGIDRYVTYVLSGGETVEADISAAEPDCDIIPQKGDVAVIYENDGYLVVNKPTGQLTHPSRAQYKNTLSNYVAGYLLEKYGDGRCHSVNRLDRGTSGAVLFAKNSYYMEKCAAALKEPTAQKAYTAIVLGALPENEGTVDAPIFRPDSRDMRRTVHRDGQRAITHYKVKNVLEIDGETVSVVNLRLETGRTHQIRVHMLHLGCPILGDRIYNTAASRSLSEKLGIEYQALHAHLLRFRDPISGEILSHTAEITREDMAKIINK